jgi:hypothetical protein
MILEFMKDVGNEEITKVYMSALKVTQQIVER